MSSKKYIPAYGPNNEIHWFPMKIASQKIIAIGEILTEKGIEHFIPYEEKVNLHKNGHKTIKVPMADLMFIHSSKNMIESLKASNIRCHALCFMVDTRNSERKANMTELEKRQINRIIVVDSYSMAKFLDSIKKIQSHVTLLQYSETFSHIGKRIRIIDGPLAGIEGVLRRVKGNKHIHIDLNNLLTAQIDYVPGNMYELLE